MGAEEGRSTQTFQKPEREESEYISSDCHKELIQKEGRKDETKAPRKGVEELILPLANDNYY